jgi:XTP/dITP diphosphohydrolase
LNKLDELIETAAILRAPGGCPWDAEQSHESLVKYLIEESYELIEAIESGSKEQVLEELGDVLYQVIFHSDLAKLGSLGEPFDIEDVAEFANQKMRSRHPHVFGTDEEKLRYQANTGEEVALNWDSHKMREKPERTSLLDGIPKGLPALQLADKVIGKAIKLGILEESSGSGFEIPDEKSLGALLLVLVMEAKSKGIDAEKSLRGTIRELEVEIRTLELQDSFDAGVVGKSD